MLMGLQKEQSLFSLDVGKLIIWAYEHGYELTGGEWWRTPEMAAHYARLGIGIKESFHLKRMAIDFNLFKDGAYLNDSEKHRPLGEYWESLSPRNRWGGNFKDKDGHPRPDGNHYERVPSGDG
jgi:hypothetical protein